MEQQQTPQFTQEQLTEWVRHHFQRANKHLAENGIMFDSVVTEESRYLAPYVAIWKIKSNKDQYYWVISGDVPADYLHSDTAPNAREAMRHFSLTWQMKADALKQGNADKANLELADYMIKRAEILYQVQEDDNFWAHSKG